MKTYDTSERQASCLSEILKAHLANTEGVRGRQQLNATVKSRVERLEQSGKPIFPIPLVLNRCTDAQLLYLIGGDVGLTPGDLPDELLRHIACIGDAPGQIALTDPSRQ